MRLHLYRVISLWLLFSLHAAFAETDRPENWARPLRMEGVPNLYQIDDGLYRSAQPSAAGMRNLEKMGIKTVINLRNFNSDRKELRGIPLDLEEMNINTWSVGDRDVIRVLRILRQRERGPFLMHCQHGADRTGVMSALYRIVEQGWSKDAALEEMQRGGYGFHAAWRNIVSYVKNVDVEKIKAALEDDRRPPTRN
jgi:protein tyrosine/serine phosphatase